MEGKKFIPGSLEKIKQVRALIEKEGRDIDLQVDGGINLETVQSVIDAGADVLVAGTATFTGGPDKYAENIKALRGK